MSSNDIAIIGAGAHAQEIEIIALENGFNVVGLFSKDDEYLEKYIDVPYLLGIGNPNMREKIDKKFIEMGAVSASPLIAKNCILGKNISLSDGVIVMFSCVLTYDIILGRHTHVNIGSTISHNCRIGNWTSLSPNCHLAGNVSLSDRVFLGIGVNALPYTEVSNDCIIGGGALIKDKLDSFNTYVGVPCRKL